MRRCICIDQPQLLCGACALIAQMRGTRDVTGSTGRIFLQSPCSLLASFQRRLAQLQLPKCGWLAFRRGAAEDLVTSGSPIGHVLHAGGWRSSAFLKYISRESLDARASLDTTLALSDSD